MVAPTARRDPSFHAHMAAIRFRRDDYLLVRYPRAAMARAATFAAVLLLAVALRAQTEIPARDPAEIKTFLTQLRRASEANDRHTIATMIRYPITISIGGLRVPFADAAAFLQRYDDVFTPALRQSIARGTDDLVIEAIDGHLRITSITVPRYADAGSTTVVPPAEAPRNAARKPEPRRVAIRVGPRPTQIPGLLARNATDSLILFLPKGRLASVRLERVPVGAAVIRVVHARTGAPLAARPSADGRFVSGRPAEGGDYRIEVRRTGIADETHLPYMLSLSLR